MKLLRHGPPGREKPGLLDGEGRIRDLSAHVDDIAGEALTPEGLARIAAPDPRGLPPVEGSLRIGPRLVTPDKAGDVDNLRIWQKPPVCLKGGEVMRPGIEGPGEQTRKVVQA